MKEEEKKEFQSFLSRYQKSNGDKLLPNTIERYVYYFKQYDLSELDGQDLIDKMQEIVNDRPAQVLYATFRMYLRFRGIKKNDDLYRKLIPPPKRANSQSSYRHLQAKVLSRVEIERLIDESDLFGKMIFLVLFNTGCRREEFMNIKHKDIVILKKPEGNIYAKINIFGKGAKNREVYLEERTVNVIKQYYPYRIPDKYLVRFYGATGEELKHQEMALYYYVKKAIQRILNKKLSVHCLRASISTHLLNNKAGLKDVSRYLGHSSSITTERSYAKITTIQGVNAFQRINEGLK